MRKVFWFGLAAVGLLDAAVAADHLETKVWQQAIDDAVANGGGMVCIPPGRHVVGQLCLKSNVELHLEKDAVLEGKVGLENYRVLTLPYSEGTWSAIVSAVGVTNVAVTGEGEIFGNGAAWPQPADYGGNQEGRRPRGLFFANCRGVRLEGFALRDAACWGVVLKCCEDVTARRVRIDSHANANNDGFDVEARNVLIEDCDVDTGDDAYCIKSNDPGFTVENVTVRNCIGRSHCNVFKLGTASHGTMRNIRFERCRAFPPRRDFVDRRPGRNGRLWYSEHSLPDYPNGLGISAMAVECVDGGTVEDVSFAQMKTEGQLVPVFVRGGTRKGRSCGTPPSDRRILRRISFEGIRSRGEGEIASSVTGVDGYRVRDVSFRDVRIVCRGASKAASAKIPYLPGGYPEATQSFGKGTILPAFGLYVDRTDGIRFDDVDFVLREGSEDVRPPVFLSDGTVVRVFDRDVAVRAPNYDKSKIAPFELEDPLTFLDGRKVTRENWPERRREILGIFAREMFGAEPPPPETVEIELADEKVGAAAGFAIRRQYRMWFRRDRTGPCFNWIVWLPRFAKGKVPVISFLNYNGNSELVPDRDIPLVSSWLEDAPRDGSDRRRAHYEAQRGRYQDPDHRAVFPLGMILSHGYAVMSMCYADISPDPGYPHLAYLRGERDLRYLQHPFAYTGVFELWGPRDESRTDNITAIGAWGWALSRGLDLAERIPEIDAKRSVVTGFSRLGKSALMAAARDERFAVCVPNQTGGGGIPLAKRDYGENISTENRMFTHWYCTAYAKYAADPARLLTFDQHLFISCIAPRALLVEGYDDPWFDTEGEYLAVRAASPVWKLLRGTGLPDGTYPDDFDESAIGPCLGYVRRNQEHGLSAYDWKWLLDFADRALNRK